MKNLNEEQVDGRFERGRGRGRGRWGKKMWLFPIGFAAMILIKAALVMLLWNYLIPDLFNGPILDYPHALGLSVLAKLLFGFGFGGRGRFAGGPGGRFGGGHGGPGGHFGGGPGGRGWGKFSREEREKMRDELRKRFEDEVKGDS